MKIRHSIGKKAMRSIERYVKIRTEVNMDYNTLKAKYLKQ